MYSVYLRCSYTFRPSSSPPHFAIAFNNKASDTLEFTTSPSTKTYKKRLRKTYFLQTAVRIDEYNATKSYKCLQL